MKTLKTLAFSILSGICLLNAQEDRFKIIEKKTMEGVKVGVVDQRTGKEILPAAYDQIQPQADGKFVIINDQKAGYADTTGKVIIKPKYLNATDFVAGRAFIFDGKKWGMIDSKDQLKGLMMFDEILGYNEGVGRVVINNRVGYINSSGVQIIPCKYDKGLDCKEKLIMVRSKYKDVWGDGIVKGQVVHYGVTSEVFVIFNEKGGVIYKGEKGENAKITPTGKIIVSKTIASPGDFSPPSYSKLISYDGKVIVPYETQYDLAIKDYWVEILLDNGIGGKGIMDFDGKIILKPNFKAIGNYEKEDNGREYAKVYFKDNSYFYIDDAGKCAELNGVKCPE